MFSGLDFINMMKDIVHRNQQSTINVQLLSMYIKLKFTKQMFGYNVSTNILASFSLQACGC